jgi:prevent-host-death family protein
VATVGAYEAKTHLSGLLKRVARGESITITKNGVPVAVLVPPGRLAAGDSREAIERIRRFREGRKLGKAKLRDLVQEGRR